MVVMRRVPRTVRVVGMVAGGRQDVVAEVDLDDPVLLVPEPDNLHDPNAVAVYHLPSDWVKYPDVLESSVRDPAGVGYLDPTDRTQMLARQAGYLPSDIAALLAPLPSPGVVGVVTTVRYAPLEYVIEGGEVVLDAPRVAGFDVTASLPPRRR